MTREGENAPRGALTNMREQHPHTPLDPLDELVTHLLDCGGVLSQIISRMVEFQASGRSAPDAAPIPDVAHSLIREVAVPVARDYSKRDLRVAAKIVDQVTEAICENIYGVDPDWFDDVTGRNN